SDFGDGAARNNEPAFDRPGFRPDREPPHRAYDIRSTIAPTPVRNGSTVGNPNSRSVFARNASAAAGSRPEVLIEMPTTRAFGLVRCVADLLAAMEEAWYGRRYCGRRRICVRVGSWHITGASVWAPCSRPSDTPA